MFGAGARLAARLDLGAIREEASQPRDVFVIYLAHVIHAECADLATRAEIAPAAAEARAAGTSIGSASSITGSVSRPVSGSVTESVARSIAGSVAGAAAH